jgi:hypothetical protein
MLKPLGDSNGKEVPAGELDEAELSSENRKRSLDGTEIAYGRSYAKNCDKT